MNKEQKGAGYESENSNVVIAIAIAMAGVVGCRYDDVENQQHEYVRDVQISQSKLGKIDFSDPDLTLIYDEGGAPFSPREILTLRFADRMLQCECFHDGNRYSVPYYTYIINAAMMNGDMFAVS